MNYVIPCVVSKASSELKGFLVKVEFKNAAGFVVSSALFAGLSMGEIAKAVSERMKRKPEIISAEVFLEFSKMVFKNMARVPAAALVA
jgi:hypothetical protein